MTDQVSSQDRTQVVYLYGFDAWVELHEDHTVVSWPGGHRRLDATASLTDVLGAVRLMLMDLTRDAEARGYKQGYRDGHRYAVKQSREGKPLRSIA